MSKQLAVEFDGVGKMYRLYKSRAQSFLDVTGLGRIAPWWRPQVDQFWALRDVSFRLDRGSRLGIIGRNGAGKTTMLKLITGNVAPTEGSIVVHGDVQALLEAGAGFHPEFSGYENIEASLIHHGLSGPQIRKAVEDIADFTELDSFLDQPFKTYSAGMQARLVFTTATAIKPDILIIDEILGAGDAYFAGKSRSRMKELVESGASILLVSHSLDQIVQFCDEAMWIERGRIVARGASLEVVRAYEEFIHTLQDRRLKAANRRRKLGFRDAVDVGEFADTFVVALELEGMPGSRLDVGTVELRREGVSEEVLRVGDVQDSDRAHLACVVLETSRWSDPRAEGGEHFRSLEVTEDRSAKTVGEMVFRSFGLEPDQQYTFNVRYRLHGEGRLTATSSRNGRAVVIGESLPVHGADWQEHEIVVDPESELAEGRDKRSVTPTQGSAARPVSASKGSPVRRWPGEGSLRIDEVVLRDSDGRERAVFEVGSPMTVSVRYRAEIEGEFPLIFAVAMFRLDGVKVTQHASPRELVAMRARERREVRLHFPSLDLADGSYVISVALFRSLHPTLPDEAERYDLVDRSYEFEVVGNPPLRTSLVVLPARWLTTGARSGQWPRGEVAASGARHGVAPLRGAIDETEGGP